jgi:hypothetical protein
MTVILTRPNTPEIRRSQLEKATADGVLTGEEVINNIAPYANPKTYWADDSYRTALLDLTYGEMAKARLTREAFVALEALIAAANNAQEPFEAVETAEATKSSGPMGIVDPGPDAWKAIMRGLYHDALAKGEVTEVKDAALSSALDASLAKGEGIVISDPRVADAGQVVVMHEGGLYVQVSGFLGAGPWQRFGDSSDLPKF